MTSLSGGRNCWQDCLITVEHSDLSEELIRAHCEKFPQFLKQQGGEPICGVEAAMDLYSFLPSEKDYDVRISEKAFWKAILHSRSFIYRSMPHETRFLHRKLGVVSYITNRISSACVPTSRRKTLERVLAVGSEFGVDGACFGEISNYCLTVANQCERLAVHELNAILHELLLLEGKQWQIISVLSFRVFQGTESQGI